MQNYSFPQQEQAQLLQTDPEQHHRLAVFLKLKIGSKGVFLNLFI